MFVNRGRGREFGEKRVRGGAHNLEKMGIGEKGGCVVRKKEKKGSVWRKQGKEWNNRT